MSKEKQKINQLETLVDSILEKLEENESTYYFMIERDDYEYYKRDYEYYQKQIKKGK